MLTTIILTFVGLFLGTLSLGWDGWLIGGAMGFVAGNLVRLSNDVGGLTKKIAALQKQLAEQQATPLEKVAKAEAPEANNNPPNLEKRIPLAERLAQQAEEVTLQSVAQPISEAHISKTPVAPPMVDTAVMAESRPAVNANQTRPVAPPPIQQASKPRPVIEPTAADKLFAAIGRFFTEGNPIVRVGIVVMFFGLSFLVKYAAGQGLIPIQLRLLAVAVIALVLIIVGWKTRTKEGGYGLVLQGGGVAGIYLTVFAALKLYGFLSPGMALVLMLIMVMLGAALAILQNAQILALVATAGGFLSPILTSDGSGNHLALFGFYLLLNIGILTIAWFKTWRMLNWVGFVFTFVITAAWGILRYEPQFYASTQPFLIGFFALYLLVSILFSIKQPPKLTGLVDASLVFGLPIVGFGLQAKLLHHTEYGLAISALVLASVYAVLARFLWVRYRETLRVLIESFIALSVMFATLSIPLALDAEWTSASWALEATGLVWIGLRQGRLLPRIAGYLLHCGAAVSLLSDGIATGMTPLLSGDFIGLFILAISALCIAYLFHAFVSNPKPREKFMASIALAIGWLWWLVAGLFELEAHWYSKQMFSAVLIFFTLSCVLMAVISHRLSWPNLRQTGFWLLPLSLIWLLGSGAVAVFDDSSLHPLKGIGGLALALLLCAQFAFLWQEREHPWQKVISGYHIVSTWMIFGLIFWEAFWWQGYHHWMGLQALTLWFACLSVPLLALLVLVNKPRWPFVDYRYEYKDVVPIPLLFLLVFWFLAASRHPGTSSFTYIPLLNLLDLIQLGAIALLAYCIKTNLLGLASLAKTLRYRLLGGAVFIWLNLVVLRGVHHFTGVEYQLLWLWQSPTAQMALSILWTLCAMVVMYLSRLRQDRQLWIAGAALLAMVVAKLFTQDLSGSGTLARIVSFMVVGGLMLLIGYVSPLPAKAPKEAAE